MSRWPQIYRRIVYGRPVVVVSGLPRSGTSMMMMMLEAGGLPVWTDGIRTPDDQNPEGYYELERIKDLDKPIDKRWVREGRGRVVKVISTLLEHLPDDNNYQVLLMSRNLHEVLASQRKMLARRGKTDDAADDATLETAYASHLRRVKRLLASKPGFTAIEVRYADVLAGPEATARQVQAFLGGRLSVQRMAAVVDGSLYRNRSQSS